MLYVWAVQGDNSYAVVFDNLVGIVVLLVTDVYLESVMARVTVAVVVDVAVDDVGGGVVVGVVVGDHNSVDLLSDVVAVECVDVVVVDVLVLVLGGDFVDPQFPLDQLYLCHIRNKTKVVTVGKFD